MLMPQLNSVQRHALDLAVRPMVGATVLTEFPKSGGTWLGRMLADLTGVPFLRHQMPVARRYIVHKHHLPGALTGSAPLVLMRDGRDVLVSLYHHVYFLRDPRTRRLTQRFRPTAPDSPAAVRADMPRFIRDCFERPIYPRFTWTTFVTAWVRHPKACVLRYEDLHFDPHTTLRKALTHLKAPPISDQRLSDVIHTHRFAAHSQGRAPGQAKPDAFLRKGIVGDWKTVFSAEAEQMFDHYAGTALAQLGYARSRATERVPA